MMASCYLVIFCPCIDAGKSSCFKGQTGLCVLHGAQSDLASTTARRTVVTAFALFLYISEPLRSSSVRSVSPRQTSRVRVTMFEETPSSQRGWPKTPLPQPAGGRRVSELPRRATGSGRRVRLHGCCPVMSQPASLVQVGSRWYSIALRIQRGEIDTDKTRCS